MKKESRKISHDLIWAIEKVRQKEDLPSFDLALRFIIEEYTTTKNKQNIYKV